MSGSSPTGQIIYKAFVPTLKMALCIIVGFIIAKKGMISTAGAKGIGSLVINVALPCLIFSSMVTAFTSTNIVAFGPLAAVAVMYQALGLFFAWLIREIFYVPIDFRWGILIAGVISNWGNLPTAVVQTMAQDAPFNSDTDVDLGVAYIAIFIFIMNTTFFGLGTHKICGWDFQQDRQIPDRLPFKQRWRQYLKAARSKVVFKRHSASTYADGEAGDRLEMEISEREPESCKNPIALYMQEDGVCQINETSAAISSPILPLHTEAADNPNTLQNTESVSPKPYPAKPAVFKRMLKTIQNLPNATWATILGIPISVVEPLKALFTHTNGWTGIKMPNAPDGKPPLHFILDTASFLGGIAVPAALLLIGASFARLKLPKNWIDLPLAAIVGLTVSKMIIVPVFGIFVVQALQAHTGLFPHHDKTAANQLVITQLYNPAGSADSLASFLLLQYALMFVLSTALAAIALYIVE
ncbi:uncharacterized protein L203_101141 [Cryptococcus depauperatus CBS 7841]|uniref:Auxin efflux carrier n=1 Tax=Cryptococcus depauperatus CBS 7841 TaxID=1295531 RepID=A0AAJ8JPE9_9TREE